PAYFQEVPHNNGWRASVLHWSERIMLTGVRFPLGQSEAADANGEMPGAGNISSVAKFLAPYFLAADRLADEYATRYRAAGLMRFGLILPATLGALLGSFSGTALGVAGMLLQFAALLSVVSFLYLGDWERSQARFISYRALAEFLRSVRL